MFYQDNHIAEKYKLAWTITSCVLVAERIANAAAA